MKTEHILNFKCWYSLAQKEKTEDRYRDYVEANCRPICSQYNGHIFITYELLGRIREEVITKIGKVITITE